MDSFLHNAKMRRSLEERLNNISPDDYRTAYALLIGKKEAEETVAEIISDLTENPEHDLVLDPQFIALLALVCDEGADIARAVLEPAQVIAMQRQLAHENPGVAERFPDLLKAVDEP